VRIALTDTVLWATGSQRRLLDADSTEFFVSCSRTDKTEIGSNSHSAKPFVSVRDSGLYVLRSAYCVPTSNVSILFNSFRKCCSGSCDRCREGVVKLASAFKNSETFQLRVVNGLAVDTLCSVHHSKSIASKMCATVNSAIWLTIILVSILAD